MGTCASSTLLLYASKPHHVTQRSTTLCALPVLLCSAPTWTSSIALLTYLDPSFPQGTSTADLTVQAVNFTCTKAPSGLFVDVNQFPNPGNDNICGLPEGQTQYILFSSNNPVSSPPASWGCFDRNTGLQYETTTYPSIPGAVNMTVNAQGNVTCVAVFIPPLRRRLRSLLRWG
jgi:hypothetical protein